MTKQTITIVAILAVMSACDMRNYPSAKTAVDVAIDCIEQMSWCKDWAPQAIPDDQKRVEACESCDEFDSRCHNRRNACQERNDATASQRFTSECQQKLALCVELVDRSSGPEEVHHHH